MSQSKSSLSWRLKVWLRWSKIVRMRRLMPKMVWRCTSVGCAVNTAEIWVWFNAACNCSVFKCGFKALTVARKLPWRSLLPDCSWLKRRRSWWASSAMLNTCANRLQARMSCSVWLPSNCGSHLCSVAVASWVLSSSFRTAITLALVSCCNTSNKAPLK